MRAKTLALCAVSVCLLASISFAANEFYLDQPSWVRPGETFEVGVMAMNDTDLAGFSFAITFNAEVLECMGCTLVGTRAEGASFVSGCTPADLLSGLAKLGVIYTGNCSDKNIPPGDGVVTILQFKVKRFVETSLNCFCFDETKVEFTACPADPIKPGTTDCCLRVRWARRAARFPEDTRGGSKRGDLNRF